MARSLRRHHLTVVDEVLVGVEVDGRVLAVEAEQAGGLSQRVRTGWPIGLAVTGVGGGERDKDDSFQGGVVLGRADQAARTGRREPVPSEQPTGGRDELEGAGPES